MGTLHISEKTGRGIPVISSEYGEGAFDFSDNDITVTIPFNFINEMGNKVGNKVGNKTEEHGLNDSQTKVLAEIRNNPNITKKELTVVCRLGRTSIDNAIAVLRKRGFIERVGSNKSGYWKAN
ncbi:MAG: MarR family transcriptional regulator [Candidatus Enterosoma sp.]|nr:MarR family transcriptional regulator [Bacilli bacterium]MDY3047297.1 MarR family transcriptional regulator [Candidatus Enterosoma sp.]